RVLTLFADRQRHLLGGDDHRRHLLRFVQLDTGRFGRAERVRDKGRRIGRPLDDVDLLAVKLVDDVLDADAADTDAGADRIDLLLPRGDGPLRAQTRFAGDLHDLDGAAVDLRHLHLEQPADEIGMGAGDDQLRPPLVAVDLDQEHLDPLTGSVALGRHLLADGHDRLGLAQLDDHRPRVRTLDDAVQHLALAVGEFLVDAVPLVVADLLENDLLGGLGGDAAEIVGGSLDADLVTDLGPGRDLPRLGRQDVVQRVFDLFDDVLDHVDM